MLSKRRTSVYDFNFYLVFVTKYRKAIFVNEQLSNEMQQSLLKIAKNKNVTVEHLEVMPDHVHMTINFQSDIAPSNVVKPLKGISAREWFYIRKRKSYYGVGIYGVLVFSWLPLVMCQKRLWLHTLKTKCKKQHTLKSKKNGRLLRSFVTEINFHVF